MAKDKKKPKCPDCKVKLIKVRSKPERYCRECGYTEPISQPTVDSPASEKQARAKAEAEHVSRIKAKRASGAVISKGLMQVPEVTMYCWSRGLIRGHAYGIQCPYPNPVWAKKMTGVEAFQFLTKIKRGNKQQKLESKPILWFNEG